MSTRREEGQNWGTYGEGVLEEEEVQTGIESGTDQVGRRREKGRN